MKKMMLVVLVVLAISIAGSVVAIAEEKPAEAEFQNVLIALDKLKKGCPYSFSEELILSDMLKELVNEFEIKISNPSLSKRIASQFLTIKARIEEILAGPCCQTTRSFKEVQEMLFDLQKDFKTPFYRKWWEKPDW